MTMCTDRFYDEMYAQRYRFLKLHRLLRDMRNPELNRDQYNMLYAKSERINFDIHAKEPVVERWLNLLVEDKLKKPILLEPLDRVMRDQENEYLGDGKRRYQHRRLLIADLLQPEDKEKPAKNKHIRDMILIRHIVKFKLPDKKHKHLPRQL